ncbi:MAG: peptidoglycan-binding protein [Pseudomonadota bacterium]
MTRTNRFLTNCAVFISLFLFIAPHAAVAQWVEPGGLHNLSRGSFTDPEDMNFLEFDDPEEKMRTWDRAIVWVPTGPNRSRRMTMPELLETYTSSDETFPTAIYLHGCAGLWEGSHLRMKFLADNGFLAIGPASLARKKYAQSCNPATHSSGMFRDVIEIRKIDAGHAIERAKALPFVDANNMLLMGLSEGAYTTAMFTYWEKDLSVKARVVEGSTCHAGVREYFGILAPSSEPVLSLVGVNDPWFQADYLRGDCGRFMNKENGSRSVVYRNGRLSYRHALLEFPEVRAETLAFLSEHFELPLGVRDVQELLAELGYDPGPIDGAWGAKTLGALNALRADKALPPVTELDQSSQDLLHSLKDG